MADSTRSSAISRGSVAGRPVCFRLGAASATARSEGATVAAANKGGPDDHEDQQSAKRELHERRF